MPGGTSTLESGSPGCHPWTNLCYLWSGMPKAPVRYYRSGSAVGFAAGAAVGVIGVAALLYFGGVDIYPPGAPPGIAERQPERLPPSTPADESGADAPAAGEPAAAQASDLSGAWYVTNRVEAADYSGYKNMTLGFQLTLRQRGMQVTGEGHKLFENGKPLQARRRTPIAVEGHIDGERLVLNFTERGAARTSAGRFVLHRTDDGSLRGRFTSDAARSSGSSIAIRARQGA